LQLKILEVQAERIKQLLKVGSIKKCHIANKNLSSTSREN